ncbi:MAG: AAA family ATPase [Myxococcales bacterium]|nr:AAA family ATPase [Myxococcales bacterium]
MKLELTDLGPIESADIRLADLTVLVGPQATGKSLFVQTLKLLLDADDIKAMIRRHGYNWRDDRLDDFLTLYFGEGLGRVWVDGRTTVSRDGRSVSLERLLAGKRASQRSEQVFVIPAQRVLSLYRGWPRAFTDFDVGDPYVVRQFSEQLRRLMELGLGSGEGVLFPRANRLRSEFRTSLEESIFHGARLYLDATRPQKQVVIQQGEAAIHYMAWSAGQREFVPLLLGLYWLMPSGGAARRKGVDWVVLEEPEMGLHPRAITSTLLLVAELLRRGYRVVMSTHAAQVLDFVWALRLLQKHEAPAKKFLELFGLPATGSLVQLADAVRTKSVATYAFEPAQRGVRVRDISTLDPEADDEATANWGGLMGFADNAAEVVAEVVAAAKRAKT